MGVGTSKMAAVASLGDAIANEWASHNWDTHHFPDIAAGGLGRSSLLRELGPDDIALWVVDTVSLPKQADIHARFGEPPVTLYSHPRFRIEALYWLDATPEIHQHSFSGAFGVLSGSSLSTHYEFEHGRRVNEHMILGTLKFKDAHVLKPGEIEPIVSGEELIHSVFHLETPSVSIVVRTHKDIEHQPQYSYRKPTVAVDPFYVDDDALLKIQILRLLRRTRSPMFWDAASKALGSSDLSGAFRLLEYLHSTCADKRPVWHCAEVVRRRFGSDIDLVWAALDEREREALLRKCRARFRSKDDRFFLALLMNVPRRDAILKLVAERYLTDTPIARLSDWAFSLSPSVSGIDFDELNRLLFKYVLENLATVDIVQRLKADHGDQLVGDEDAYARHCDALRSTFLFRPLLVPPL